MAERNLTTKDILQKQFKPALRGFNTEEVDEFLDLIIRDYESYEKELAYLRNEVDRLKHQSSSQRSNKTTNEGKEKSSASANVGTTNYDILRRLSKLEKAVFGNQSRSQARDNDDSEDNDTVVYEK
ncbi:cell division regulator GpsB [Aerococcus kribbianus]|uniref:Cell division regulator GpsB n=1 Tax=Aerococcus kribbianus TaxID=2999064 RepID=A0A9X3FLW8_9LACT|nr:MULTISPECIES: cell division regulator GpsB [unclassified Aerococcus]MCZ0716937.1 cell division regulator GpsB [Aerococcus sp. YH-aer221]MCZ0725225.1 cell division regulator GpsB [Aerococcus sp. YH-aer222]